MAGHARRTLLGLIKDTTLNEQTEFFNIMRSSSTLRDNLADEVVLFCLDQPK